MLLVGIIVLICEMTAGNADPLLAESGEATASPVVEIDFSDPIGTIKSSELQVNRTYNLIIKKYPDEEHLLVLDLSNVGKNRLEIFGDTLNKKTSCLTYHLKGSESCRKAWVKNFSECPLRTMVLQDIRITLLTTDLSKSTLITYKTVNCTSGVEATQKTAVADCRQSSKSESHGGLSTLEFTLLIALAFVSSLALIFGTILLRILCRTRGGTDSSSAEDFVYKKNSNHVREGPVLVDNVLYASVADDSATEMRG